MIDYTGLKFRGIAPLTVSTGRTADAGDASVASKINGLENRPVRIAAGAAVGKAGADRAATQEKPPGAAASDVQITGIARGLAALEQKLRDAPAVDEARVASVRQKLDDGSYHVDPQRVADKLLRLERELGGGKQSK
jgi:negative regulator of flagellin synthesis FlgM